MVATSRAYGTLSSVLAMIWFVVTLSSSVSEKDERSVDRGHSRYSQDSCMFPAVYNGRCRHWSTSIAITCNLWTSISHHYLWYNKLMSFCLLSRRRKWLAGWRASQEPGMSALDRRKKRDLGNCPGVRLPNELSLAGIALSQVLCNRDNVRNVLESERQAAVELHLRTSIEITL